MTIKKTIGYKVAKAGTAESYQNVLLEEMRSNFKLVFEKLESSDEKMDAHGPRLDRLEKKVDQNTLGIEACNRRIDECNGKIDQNTRTLSNRIDSLNNRIDDCNGKIDQNTLGIMGLSAKMDQVFDRLDRQDEKIAVFQSA